MRIRTKAVAGLASFLTAAAMGAVWGPPAFADTDAVAPSVLAILAHPDDDLLFMEPDMKQDYELPSTTVYVTGGDSTTHGDQEKGTEFPDPCAYSNSRFEGLRAAHARGVQGATWTKTAISVNGRTIEEDTLDQRPTTKLVFLRLHEAGNGHFKSGEDGFYNIYDLFVDPKAGLREKSEGTDPADGGNDCDPQYANQYYTHDDLLKTLTDLMARYQASTVLSLDPNVGYNYVRNIDHIGVSRFVGAASQGWHGPGGRGHLLLRDYRTYTISVDPANLDPVNSADKENEFLTYLGPDRGDIPGRYHGTYDPEPNPKDPVFYGAWVHREYPRWTNGVNWAALDSAGRLNAVAMLDNKVQVWREDTSGGSWTGPTPVPGDAPLSSNLTLIKDGSGLLHIVGIRLSDSQIVTTARDDSGTWGPWTELGNPNNPQERALTGDPAVVVERDGRLTVFVRNWGLGVSALKQNPNGTWPSDWADLKGYLVRDDLTAGVSPLDGHVELFAPSINGLLHWSENLNTGVYPIDAVPVGPPTAGPVSFTRNADGRMQIFYVQAGTGAVASQWQRTTGFWTTWSSSLGTVGLEGVSANAGSDGRMTLATRNRGGGVSLAVQDKPNIGFSGFPDLGNVVLGAPVVALDGHGRQVVLAFERDAGLHVARQSAPGADSPYGAWELAGN
jgi:LmbE family N-acetylglucosaminyl deacetylase